MSKVFVQKELKNNKINYKKHNKFFHNIPFIIKNKWIKFHLKNYKSRNSKIK